MSPARGAIFSVAIWRIVSRKSTISWGSSYRPGAKSVHDGENAANYQSPEYDMLYARLRFMDDGPAKQQLIDEMQTIAREDAPWMFGYHPFAFGAYAPWVRNGKPGMARDVLRFHRLDRIRRNAAELLAVFQAFDHLDLGRHEGLEQFADLIRLGLLFARDLERVAGLLRLVSQHEQTLASGGRLLGLRAEAG